MGSAGISPLGQNIQLPFCQKTIASDNGTTAFTTDIPCIFNSTGHYIILRLEIFTMIITKFIRLKMNNVSKEVHATLMIRKNTGFLFVKYF